jgi:hypothetical protein
MFSQVSSLNGITGGDGDGAFTSPHLKKPSNKQQCSVIAWAQEGQNEKGVVAVGAADAIPM